MDERKLREKAANISLDLGLMGAGSERIYEALKDVLCEERERCARISENVPDKDHIDGKLSRECECRECRAVTKVADMIRAQDSRNP